MRRFNRSCADLLLYSIFGQQFNFKRAIFRKKLMEPVFPCNMLSTQCFYEILCSGWKGIAQTILFSTIFNIRPKFQQLNRTFLAVYCHMYLQRGVAPIKRHDCLTIKNIIATATCCVVYDYQSTLSNFNFFFLPINYHSIFSCILIQSSLIIKLI